MGGEAGVCENEPGLFGNGLFFFFLGRRVEMCHIVSLCSSLALFTPGNKMRRG